MSTLTQWFLKLRMKLHPNGASKGSFFCQAIFVGDIPDVNEKT